VRRPARLPRCLPATLVHVECDWRADLSDELRGCSKVLGVVGDLLSFAPAGMNATSLRWFWLELAFTAANLALLVAHLRLPPAEDASDDERRDHQQAALLLLWATIAVRVPRPSPRDHKTWRFGAVGVGGGLRREPWHA